MTTTMKRLAALTAGGALLLVVVWYLALLRPQNHKLSAAHKDRAASEQKIQSLNGQIAQLEALEKEKPADTQKLVIYTAAIPDNPQLPSVLRLIQNDANSTGVTMPSINPAPPASQTATTASTGSTAGGATSLAVTIAADGTYQQATAFIAALEAMPRTLVITGVNINSSSGDQLTVDLSANIYYAGQPTP